MTVCVGGHGGLEETCPIDVIRCLFIGIQYTFVFLLMALIARIVSPPLMVTTDVSWQDVLETMEDLKASPSPLTKRPALTRLSSFATEARTKKRNDRNIL